MTGKYVLSTAWYHKRRVGHTKLFNDEGDLQGTEESAFADYANPAFSAPPDTALAGLPAVAESAAVTESSRGVAPDGDGLIYSEVDVELPFLPAVEGPATAYLVMNRAQLLELVRERGLSNSDLESCDRHQLEILLINADRMKVRIDDEAVEYTVVDVFPPEASLGAVHTDAIPFASSCSGDTSSKNESES